MPGGCQGWGGIGAKAPPGSSQNSPPARPSLEPPPLNRGRHRKGRSPVQSAAPTPLLPPEGCQATGQARAELHTVSGHLPTRFVSFKQLCASGTSPPVPSPTQQFLSVCSAFCSGRNKDAQPCPYSA